MKQFSLIIIFFMSLSCSEKKAEEKTKEIKFDNYAKYYKTPNNNIDIVGTWKIDSIFNCTLNSNNSLQGYIFKKNSNVQFFEKTEGSLLINGIGTYILQEKSLDIGEYLDSNKFKNQIWEIDISGKKLIMKAIKYDGQDLKPLIFLTKIAYKEIDSF